MRYIDPELWAKTWKAAGSRLEEIRRRELGEVDVSAVLDSFAGVFEAVSDRLEPRATSGLVEQQRLFGRLRG